MPKKASGPKKARWTAAQKNEARKAPKKAHHRGQPDGPKSAPKRSARPGSAEGYTKRPRAERSPRWDREDPRRGQSGPGRTDDNRGSRYSSGPADRGTTSNRTPSSNRDDRNDRPKRWVSDSREERHVHRPHDERPRAERSPRWDREDPRRQAGSGRPSRDDSRSDSRGSRYSAGPSDRPTSNRTTNPSTRDARDDRPKRWVSDSREERHVHRPHDERPRLERGERPVRDRAPRVADPARREPPHG